MYYMQEHHESIISERMFNQVQEILQKRRGVQGSGRRKGNFSRKYPFSSRLYFGLGEKDGKGKINPRVITFILKSGNEIKCEEDRNSVTEEISVAQNNINQQSSYENQGNYLQKVSEPC